MGFCFPKGPCTQQLGTWVLGNSNYNTVFEKVYLIGYLNP